jgi:serine O-acetyltransferase
MNIVQEIKAIRERDPAAFSLWQVVLFYPGVHALIWHRLAHAVWRRNWRLFAVGIAALSRFLTGIEIHPGAKIGRRVFIDHGMGVAIGETAQVGDDCTIYQGVTLGATSHAKGPRHPIVGERVTIGAGAKILGRITIGNDALISPNAIVVRPIPNNARVVQSPSPIMEL